MDKWQISETLQRWLKKCWQCQWVRTSQACKAQWNTVSDMGNIHFLPQLTNGTIYQKPCEFPSASAHFLCWLAVFHSHKVTEDIKACSGHNRLVRVDVLAVTSQSSWGSQIENLSALSCDKKSLCHCDLKPLWSAHTTCNNCSSTLLSYNSYLGTLPKKSTHQRQGMGKKRE